MFVKANTSAYSDILLKEAHGLASLNDLLQQTGNTSLKIPYIYKVNDKVLHLEKIDDVQANSAHMEALGLGLAHMHQQKQACFGFDEDNYIGLNPQKNCISDNWGKFFVEQRLQFQIDLIKCEPLKKEFSSVLMCVKNDLETFLNKYSDFPSLLHGDLWSGNVMFSSENGLPQVWLIDPAVYYGDREADIAMTEMFGGFSKVFYSAYDKVFPLSEVYKEKKVIYNLYHYLNHYNLFGRAYQGECERGFAFLQKLFYLL